MDAKDGRRCAPHGESVAQTVLRGELGGQELDGDRPVEPHLACEIDDAHAAAAQLALERVPASDGSLELEKERVGEAIHAANVARRPIVRHGRPINS